MSTCAYQALKAELAVVRLDTKSQTTVELVLIRMNVRTGDTVTNFVSTKLESLSARAHLGTL